MAEAIRMPAFGQTTGDLKIIAWRKAAGDAVRQGDVLLEVETDKATLDVEAYTSGVLLKIVRAAGEMVEVGATVAYIGQPGETVAEPPRAAPAAPASAAPATPAPARGPVAAPGKALASPVARKLAQDHALDIAVIPGSGPGGRVEKEDVLAFAARQPEQSAAPSVAADTIAASRLRGALAERLARSFRDIPHIYLTARLDMTAAQQTVAAAPDTGGARPGYTHLVLQAAARALRAEPRLNRLWLEGGRIRTLAQANVGLAVAGDDSLIVVTIPEPDKMTLADLAAYSKAAAERARAGRLADRDLAACSLTVSNLGMYGVEEFAAIIDPQQAAILAVGRVADEPVALDGQVVVRPRMAVTLSADHRVIDGVVAARFLAAFRAALEQPAA